MNDTTKKAIEKMQIIKTIINAEIGDIDKYYILQWFNNGWRDESWVLSEIEYRKSYPMQELKENSI